MTFEVPMSQFIRYLTLAAAVVALSACASRYPEQIRTEATDLVEFSQAQRQAEANEGGTARWGGVIADVRNSEERTRIEVVSFRLNNFGRPQASDQSDGRFVVYLDEFVDPEIYQRGRMITALGEFSGLERGQIGDFNYYYPVLNARGVELWRPQQQSAPMMHAGFGYYDPHSLWYRNHLYGVGPYRYYYHPYHPWGLRPVRVVPLRPAPPPRRHQRQQGSVEPQGATRPREQQH